MTADFSCPCGTTAQRRPDDEPDQAAAFDETVARHFAGVHS